MISDATRLGIGAEYNARSSLMGFSGLAPQTQHKLHNLNGIRLDEARTSTESPGYVIRVPLQGHSLKYIENGNNNCPGAFLAGSPRNGNKSGFGASRKGPPTSAHKSNKKQKND